jgi:hypothetical protein
LIVDEHGVETELFSLDRRGDDGFGRRLESEIVGVRGSSMKTERS